MLEATMRKMLVLGVLIDYSKNKDGYSFLCIDRVMIPTSVIGRVLMGILKITLQKIVTRQKHQFRRLH